MRYVHFLPGFLQKKNTSVGLLLKFRNSPDFQLEFSHFYFQIRGHIWKEKWVNSHFFYQTNYLSKLKKFTKIRIFNCCYTKCTVDYYFQYFCGLFPESLQNFANGDIFIYIPSYEGNRLPSKVYDTVCSLLNTILFYSILFYSWLYILWYCMRISDMHAHVLLSIICVNILSTLFIRIYGYEH